MKTRVVTIVVLSLVNFALDACGQGLPRGAISFHVHDDFGKPIEGATVTVSTFHHWQPGDGFGKDVTESFKGKTDRNGVVEIVGESLRGDFAYGVAPLPGFYRGGVGEFKFDSVVEGKWEPWSPNVDIVLKPIIQPTPMYARKVGEPDALRIPESGKAIGFDLIVSDWIAPHGRGTTADVIFKLERRFTSFEEPFEVTLTLTFSNKGDGIQSVLAAPFAGSELKLPRSAPEDGYAPQLVRRKVRPGTGKPVESNTREDLNYFVRLRTVLDENKRVKSAIYGKFDGDFQFWPNEKLRFTYYLNPNVNDRNMEFDVKRNLFGKLPNSQRPSAP